MIYLRLVEYGFSDGADGLHLLEGGLDPLRLGVDDPEGSHVHLVVVEVLQVKPKEIRTLVWRVRFPNGNGDRTHVNESWVKMPKDTAADLGGLRRRVSYK